MIRENRILILGKLSEISVDRGKVVKLNGEHITDRCTSVMVIPSYIWATMSQVRGWRQSQIIFCWSKIKVSILYFGTEVKAIGYFYKKTTLEWQKSYRKHSEIPYPFIRLGSSIYVLKRTMLMLTTKLEFFFQVNSQIRAPTFQ